MMELWTRLKQKMVSLMGSDIDVVRKVNALDQRHREIGHKLRNNQMRLHSLTRLVESMRADGETDAQDRNSVH